MATVTAPRAAISAPERAARAPVETGVVIVGSGFAGLGMAIRLRQAGWRDFVVLEQGEDVGGTWRDNTYPGCMCDVPSHLYSFSFAPNADWSCTYPKQAEIWEYLRRCAGRFGVTPHLRFGHQVTSARWDASASRWVVDTNRGAFNARFLVLGVGSLSEPRMPDIAGIDSFRGTLFHSARWRHDHDLSGERVAVVGTGASAIQFIPEVQPRARTLTVFQRTPAWVLPHPNRDLTHAERWVSRRVPGALKTRRFGVYMAREMLALGLTVDPRLMTGLEALARQHLRTQVRDPALRAKLTPQYRIGCKRILISNDFYPAMTRDNVELVTDRIVAVSEHGVRTADGRERPVDTIIVGTGFHVTDMPAAGYVFGRDGRSLGDTWQGSPQAYLGTTIAGFPNLFFLNGPNVGIGHTSLVFMIEGQIDYALDAMLLAHRQGLRSIEVRADVQARYNAAVQRRMRRTVWVTGGCASWYIDRNGRNSTLWPSVTWPFRRRTRRFDARAYVLQRGAPVALTA